MKLYISFNMTNLAKAIEIAEQTAQQADILGIGHLLLLKEGIKAIELFRKTFPTKELFVESPIIEKGAESVTLFAQAGANYVSILAGAPLPTMKNAIETAQQMGVKIGLDLLDSESIGQSALDAKTIGAQFLVLQRADISEDTDEIENSWRNVRDNTTLPIFITGKINESNIAQVAQLKPYGIIIGSAITKADNPAQKAIFFKTLL